MSPGITRPSALGAADLSLGEFIDSRPVGRFHYVVLALSGSVMFLDGFDTQAISFAAPVIAREWGIPVASLGPILSAAIVGLMVGYLVLSPLANRVGHRRLVVCCTALFGVLSLLTAAASEPAHLIGLRCLTGAGLGAVIPSLVSLTSEYAPKRRRSSFVMFIYCWLALGFVAAGLVSGLVIPVLGWRMMFVIGGVVPLLLLVFLVKSLPESPRFLLSRPRGIERTRSLLHLLDPMSGSQVQGLILTPPEEGPKKRPSRVADLFSRGWLGSTVLLWVAFAANLAAFYAIQSWLPTIVGSFGQPQAIVIAATVLTTIGGIVAATVIGPCMDRISPFRTLGFVYLMGALFVAVLGLVIAGGPTLLLIVAFLSGACVTGGQMSVTALASLLYPPAMRSTGVGWALGVGRLGGIAGPLLVGTALGQGVAAREVFFAIALVLVLAGTTVFRIGRIHR
ncbi:AAHS family 4-hydroxybenzoate transporter-like MFS transporter [Pseudarthrobacter sp. W1I19]|uniref:MFS transporter n=1 Tax=Pseudarthrobacter sp. W1I19 TaxID=3042288 RepID=UPI00277FBABC|nr:MFS transporter [Pseudarthrobacter sp. W1I19]MDQ0923848.1 AAHS family 4-hydroxybenzoate transporter-like MFS transporter [Pseudarthrobacter sp. W1I19]